MLSSSLRFGSTLRQRCPRTPIAGFRPPADWACARRNFSSRFSNTKKKRVEVLEKEYEAPNQQSAIPHEQRGSYYEQHQQAGSAPSSSVFPSYVASRDREEREGSTYDNLSSGIVGHMQKENHRPLTTQHCHVRVCSTPRMRPHGHQHQDPAHSALHSVTLPASPQSSHSPPQVYGTLATGIGISAGASLFSMATPLVTMHPLIPGWWKEMGLRWRKEEKGGACGGLCGWVEHGGWRGGAWCVEGWCMGSGVRPPNFAAVCRGGACPGLTVWQQGGEEQPRRGCADRRELLRRAGCDGSADGNHVHQ